MSLRNSVTGSTGTGKSTALSSLLIQDIANGEGCALIDPHGDLAERVIEFIPRHRTNDVVLFDAADIDHPVGDHRGPSDRSQVHRNGIALERVLDDRVVLARRRVGLRPKCLGELLIFVASRLLLWKQRRHDRARRSRTCSCEEPRIR